MASPTEVRNAISGFLGEMLEKKLTDRQKELKELTDNGVGATHPKMVAAVSAIEALERNYDYDYWLNNAATKMVNQVTLATHISKGVHSMSRGDSVLFKNSDNLPRHLSSSHDYQDRTDVLDVSGSAASLPLYNFINTVVTDGVTIKDLIVSSSPSLLEVLSDDPDTAQSYLDAFQGLFSKKIDQPITSDLNKQLLFPTNADCLNVSSISDLGYVNVVPLYASVFSQQIRTAVNDIRFSEQNRAAITNRFASDANPDEQVPYQTVSDLAVLKLGGTKPANISKVVVMSSGEVLLLPSLPPHTVKASQFEISKRINSLFENVSFGRKTKSAFYELGFAFAQYHNQANYENKQARKNALQVLLTLIFNIANELRDRDAGWLAGYNLTTAQTFWLDPNRGSLAGQEAYQAERDAINWQDQVLADIANHINSTLKTRLVNYADEFDRYTFDEWRIEATAIAHKYKLNGNEVLS